MPKSSTQKSRELRAKRSAAGLKEVRGIWATTDQEKDIKKAAKELLKGEKS